MTVRRALKEAWALYKAHPGDMLLFVFLQAAVRLIALCPLLFLADPGLSLGALACIPLWALLVLPARQRAAEVMQTTVRGGRLFAKRLLIGPDWGRHLAHGLKMALLMLLWLLPFIAATVIIVYCYKGGYKGGIDFATLLLWIKENMGGGDLMTGLKPVAVIYLVTLIPFLFGLAFHSGRRHERALSDRRFLKGHRGGVIRAWFAGLITLIPFAAATVATVAEYILSVLRAVVAMMNDFASTVTLPSLDSRVIIVAAAFVLLLLPLVPLKSLITACYVHGCWEGRE